MKGADVVMKHIVQYSDWLDDEVTNGIIINLPQVIQCLVWKFIKRRSTNFSFWQKGFNRK